MDIDDLKLFRSVAKLGSFSKAGDEWNFVQSTVTAKMQKLEHYFKTPLFHRHRYGVTLTSAGKNLLGYADQIAHLFSEAEKAIMTPEVPTGPVFLGSMETTAAIRLPSVLSEYHKRYPDIDVTLKTGTSAALIKAVLAYELDGAFVAGPIRHPDLEELKVFEEELVLLSKDKLPYTDGALDLRSSKLLVFREGCTYRKILDDWLQADQLKPGTTMEFGSLEVILGCVYAGLGVSLLPKSVLARTEPHYDLCYAEIPEPFGKVPTCFIHRNDVTPTLAIRKFLELIEAAHEDAIHRSERKKASDRGLLDLGIEFTRSLNRLEPYKFCIG